MLTASGKLLPHEPVETWQGEIRALRNLAALWDGVAVGDEDSVRRVLPQHQAAKRKDLFHLAREHLARRITERIPGGRLELIAPPDEGPSQFTIRLRPARLIDAIWQQFAAEVAGLMTAVRCLAPGCGRWFSKNGGRGDRQFCSHSCQMRSWRNGG